MRGSLLVAVILTLLAGCASFPAQDMYSQNPLPTAGHDKALVIVFYETHTGTRLFSSRHDNIPVYFRAGYHGGKVLSVLVSKSYAPLFLGPGVYRFRATFEGGHGNGIPYEVQLDSGAIYYLRITQHYAAWSNDITIALSDAQTFDQLAQGFLDCGRVDCRSRRYMNLF